MPAPDTLRHLSDLYAHDPDPWDHGSSDYERGKHDATVRAAGPRRWRNALEIGCGNGVLAERLAPHCARLTAMDCIPSAVALARARLRRLPNVTVCEGDATALPVAAPDLVVLSEMLYFLQPDEVSALAGTIAHHAAPDGRVVSVNWLGSTGERLSGREAADLFARGFGRWRRTRHQQRHYLLDVFDAPQRVSA